MKTWRVAAGTRIEGLQLADEPAGALAPTQLRLRTRAATLNYRDLMVVNGWYMVATKAPLVPGSDAAGDVMEVGSAVTRFKVGDRVATSFFPHWVEGAMTPAKIAGATRVQGVFVGSRQMHEDLARFVEVAKTMPVVDDKVFSCTQAPDAYRYFEAGRHFGKVALDFS
jgi:NADPH:quinone reductase-like Zn-dependent oxidoreductase